MQRFIIYGTLLALISVVSGVSAMVATSNQVEATPTPSAVPTTTPDTPAPQTEQATPAPQSVTEKATDTVDYSKQTAADRNVYSSGETIPETQKGCWYVLTDVTYYNSVGDPVTKTERILQCKVGK